jgi:hypothetical protein
MENGAKFEDSRKFMWVTLVSGAFDTIDEHFVAIKSEFVKTKRAFCQSFVPVTNGVGRGWMEGAGNLLSFPARKYFENVSI